MLKTLRSFWSRDRVSLPRTKRNRPRVETLEDRLAPATLTVNTIADNTTAGDNLLTLREAIAAVNAGGAGSLSGQELGQITGSFGSNDTIQFASALNGQTITMTGARYSITKSVSITGPGANQLTIDGGFDRQIFFIDGRDFANVNVNLNGLKLTKGSAEGGGMMSGNLDNSLRGGAVFNDSATLTVVNCNVVNNQANNLGGAIYNLSGTLNLTNSYVSGNTAGNGSGIVSASGAANITQCFINFNTSDFNFGAVLNTIDSVNNQGPGTMTIVQSTITDNRISDNPNQNSLTHGAGVFTLGTCTTTFRNTVVATNRRTTPGDPFTNTPSDIGGDANAILLGNNNYIGVTVIGNVTNSLTNGANGNIIPATVPDFTDLFRESDFRASVAVSYVIPKAGSPLLNVGSNANAPAGNDLRGGQRILDTTVDIGAVEGSYFLGPFVVDTTSDTDDNLYSAGQLSLREAIRLSNENPVADTISFASSLTSGAGSTITLTSALPDLASNITITGPSDPTRLKISGNDQFRVLNITAPGVVTASGITITGGRTAGAGNHGAGIQNLGSLTLTNAIVTGNTSVNFGGGIENRGTLVVTNSTISNNTGTFGAGIDVSGGGTTTTLIGTTISGNTATSVGGGLFADGTTTIVNSTISGNSAGGAGGGIRSDATSLTVLNSVITGNVADSNNDDSNNGGGIFRNFGSVQLFNTIVAGNTVNAAPGQPNAVANDIDGTLAAVSVNNLIGNPATSGGLTHGTLGNILGNGSGGIIAIGSIINTTLANNGGPTLTHALAANSPAINAGNNTPANLPSGLAMPTTDQRGFSRIDGGTIDIGPVEIDASAPTVVSYSDDDADNVVVVNTPVTYVVTFSEDTLDGDVTAADFVNAGTSTVTFGAITEFDPGQFSVEVTPTTPGTLQLRIPTGAVITDLAGNTLVPPSTDATILTVNSAVPPFSGDLIVDTTSDTVDNNFGPGQLSLREAILIANNRAGADPITFATSLNGQTITLSLGSLVVTSPVTITGNGVARTIISGADSFRAFTIDDGNASVSVNVSLSGLTITSGNDQTDEGGGINSAENLTLDRVAIIDNFGGGMVQRSPGTLTITRSSVTGNRTPRAAGGISTRTTGVTSISQTTVSGNVAQDGSSGGLFLVGPGAITISNSTISGNSATTNGGALRVGQSATVLIVNSTISGNSAQNNGGGISNNGVLTVVNSTITLNGADSNNDSTTESGGGIFTETGKTTRLFNTIVAGNFVDAGVITDPNIVSDDVNGANVDASSANNLISEPTASGGLTNGTNGNIVGDAGDTLDITTVLDIGLIPGPSFQLDATQGLRDNGGPTKTHALVQNSLAIGGAATTHPNYSPYDQRGAARDAGDPDIGSYEVQHPLAPVGVPTTYADTFLPKGSPDAITSFVKGLYNSTLLREADSDGLAIWVGALNAGTSRSAVAYGFVNSDENRGNQIKFYYRYFLGREAEVDEVFSVWVPVLRQNGDEAGVMTQFALSDEFSGQNDNNSFVNLMYYALLGRAAEPQGFSDWIGSINNGVPRSQVVASFLRSDESIYRVIDGLFASYLKHAPDTATRNGFLATIKGGDTFGTAAAFILATDEFFAAADANR